MTCALFLFLSLFPRVLFFLFFLFLGVFLLFLFSQSTSHRARQGGGPRSNRHREKIVTAYRDEIAFFAPLREPQKSVSTKRAGKQQKHKLTALTALSLHRK